MGRIRCVRCEKLQRDFVARNFKLIKPVQYVLQQVSCSYKNDPKCTQILRNGPKPLFRVQWGGLGAFVAENHDVTSWHELLH